MITCPRCSREIPATDISLENAIARCTECNVVFACGQGQAEARYSKPTCAMPDGFTAVQDGPDFVLERRWKSAKAWGLLFFCVFWDGFLVFWYAIAFTVKGPLIMKLFPLIHVAVGAGVSYLTAALFVNRTTIRVGAQQITVRHHPLPWPGEKELPRRELQQLFCKEKVNSGKNGVTYSYDVVALLAGEKRSDLVTGLDEPNQALFIEQRIERQLGIIDKPVKGEMRS